MYIKQRGIESLRKYQYRGVDLSYFSKYLFQPFWQRFVLIFPLWIAPNLITLTGFAFLFVSCSLSYIYSSDLITPSPSWLFILHGLLLFLYQTFDAVDGKQARRTNSSSPLGELFDHGCDALACTVEALTLGSMLLAGKKVVLFWAIGTCAFFFATWETFYTHTLLLNVVNGPTEGLLIIYLGHFFTAIVGPEWWTLDFRQALFLPPFFSFIKNLPMNDVMLWLFFVMALIPTNISSILSVKEVVSKGKRGSMAYAYLLLIPYSSLVALTIAWAYFSPSDIAKLYPYIFLISNGFGFAYLVGRIILAHLTNESENLFFNMCKPLLFLPLATVNAFVASYLNIPTFIDEKLLLLLHFIYTALLYSHFVWKVIHEICSILNIYCLRIKRHNSTD